MDKIGKHRIVRLVFPLCTVLVAGSLAWGASVAAAGPLEGLSGPVGEATKTVEEVTNVVPPPVVEATETAVPAVGGITETAVPPVGEVTETVVPPVEKAGGAAAKATEEVTHAVPPPVAANTPKLPKVPSVQLPAGVSGSETAEVAGSVVGGATRTATHAAVETLGTVTGSDRSSAGDASGVDAERVPGVVAPTESVRPSSTANVPGAPGPGNRDGSGDGDRFNARSTDGSVRAPVPKWVAYVWPAIALTRPQLANFLRRWERDGVRLLLPGAAGGTAGQGVAGAHASHDAGTGAPDHSSGPFAEIPAAVGGFTSSLPSEALAYLALVAILVAVVFAGVKFEMARRDRQSG